MICAVQRFLLFYSSLTQLDVFFFLCPLVDLHIHMETQQQGCWVISVLSWAERWPPNSSSWPVGWQVFFKNFFPSSLFSVSWVTSFNIFIHSFAVCFPLLDSVTHTWAHSYPAWWWFKIWFLCLPHHCYFISPFSPFPFLYLLSGLVAWACWIARTIAQLLGPSVWLQMRNRSDAEEEGKENGRKRGVVVMWLRSKTRILNKGVWRMERGEWVQSPPSKPPLTLYPSFLEPKFHNLFCWWTFASVHEGNKNDLHSAVLQ